MFSVISGLNSVQSSLILSKHEIMRNFPKYRSAWQLLTSLVSFVDILGLAEVSEGELLLSAALGLLAGPRVSHIPSHDADQAMASSSMGQHHTVILNGMNLHQNTWWGHLCRVTGSALPGPPSSTVTSQVWAYVYFTNGCKQSSHHLFPAWENIAQWEEKVDWSIWGPCRALQSLYHVWLNMCGCLVHLTQTTLPATLHLSWECSTFQMSSQFS